MKTELKAKFLQHLNQKRDKGFTLIELLVVIIIIGILSAIALPSFLNQANKAKQSEAKQYIGSMNRSQQATFAESGRFATSVGELNLGIKTQTQNYNYALDPIAPATNATEVGNVAQPIGEALKAYAGKVALIQPAGATERTTAAVLCERTAAGAGPVTGYATVAAASLGCTGTAWTEVSK
ncbi:MULTISPECIES: type IV pilin-like G/H family protein [unclassified Microcoleus]|uniref:type IV pilin-like G/H family protein n=1 Tax=unclassified Microcoleus TaxID=2642155 RepID=UPI002FD2AFCF